VILVDFTVNIWGIICQELNSKNYRALLSPVRNFGER